MILVGDLLAVLRAQDMMSPIIQNAEKNLRGFKDTIGFSSEEVRRFEKSLNLPVNSLQKLGEETRATGTQLESLMGKARGTTDAIRGTSYQMTLAGRGMLEAGVLLTGLSVAIGAVIRDVIQFGGEFEKQMTRVITLAGATKEQIAEMRQPVLDLAVAAGVGPSELAKGLYVLMSTGRSTAEAMDQLKVSAQMTAIGMGNMHDTTLAVTGAVFAYQKQNLTAADAANILIKSVQLGNMEIQELVPAIARVNPIAAAMGVGFRDVAATIATFTHAGVDAAMAATGVRAMLNNILTDSVKTEKGFAALAKVTGDNTVTMANFRKEMKDKGMVQAMVDLADKTNQYGDASVKAFGQIFPNIRALTQALFVFRENGGMVTNFMKDMNDGVDELAIGTKELHKTWAWQWEQMKVSVEVMWISLSDSLLPMFKSLGSFLTNVLIPAVKGVVSVFNSLPVPFQVLILLFVSLLGIVGPVLIFFGQLTMSIGNIARALPWLTTFFGLNAKAATTAATANLATAAAITSVGTAAAAATPALITYEAAAARMGVALMYGSTGGPVGKGATRFVSLKPTMEAMRAEAALAATAVTSVGTAAATAQVPATTFGATVSALALPLTLVVTGASAVAIGIHSLGASWAVAVGSMAPPIGMLMQSWDKFKDSVEQAKPIWKEFEDFAYKISNLITDTIVVVFDRLKTKIIEVFVALRDVIPGARDFIFIWTVGQIGIKQFLDNITELKITLGNLAQTILSLLPGYKDYVMLTLLIKYGYSEAKKMLDDYSNSMKRQADQVRGNISGAHELAAKTITLAEVQANSAAVIQKLSTGAVGAAVANRTLLDSVAALTSVQRAAIDAGKASGLNSKQILEAMSEEGIAIGVTAEMIGVYEKQMTSAARETKVFAKESEKAATALTDYNRITDSLIEMGMSYEDQLKMTSKEWSEMAITAGNSLKSISNATGEPIAALFLWMNQIKMMKMEQEKFAKDTITSQNAVEVSLANIAALQIKTDGDVYETKIALVDKWAVIETNKINKLSISWTDYWTRLVVLAFERQAKINAIDAEQVIKHQEIIDQLTATNEQWSEYNLALWERYSGIIQQTELDSGNSQLAIIRANAIKAEAENQRHLDRELAQIKKNKALEFWEQVYWSVKATQLAKETTEAILAIKEAQEFDARTDIIVKALDRISQKLGDVARIARDAWKIISNNAIDPKTGEAVVSTSNKWVAGLAAASAIANQVITSTGKIASAIKGALSMAASGAAIGSMFGPMGTAVGAVAGAITGLITGWNAAAKASIAANQAASDEILKMEVNLLNQYGSLANIKIIGDAMGVSLAEAWGSRSQEGLAHFNILVSEFEAKMKALQSALDKYGLSWKDMGQEFKQMTITTGANKLLDELSALTGAGVDWTKAVTAMAPAFSQMVADALASGTTLPDAFLPILKFLEEMNLLTKAPINIASEAGYKTVAELQIVADKAKAVYDFMLASGQYSASELAKAFKAAGDAQDAVWGNIADKYKKQLDELESEYKSLSDSVNKEAEEAVMGVVETQQRARMAQIEIEKVDLEAKKAAEIAAAKEASASSTTAAENDYQTLFRTVVSRSADAAREVYQQWKRAPWEDWSRIPSPPVYPQASGGDYLVSKPTLFLAGEAGTERATFTPAGRSSGGSTNVTVVVQAWDGASVDSWLRRGGNIQMAEAIVPKIPSVVKRYGLGG